jgi:hypothetical protein
MKLTKDELKKIIQEEVANMQEQFRVAGVGTIDDDEPESEKSYVSRMAKKDDQEKERARRSRAGAEWLKQRAKDKAEEEEEQYQRDQTRRSKNRQQQQAYKKGVADDKMELVNTFIKFGGEDFKKSFEGDWDSNADGFLGSWLEIAKKDLGKEDDPLFGISDIKRFLKKNKYGVYKPKRNFMQKAASFLGFKEDITKEDIQKMVQEELEAVTKGN